MIKKKSRKALFFVAAWPSATLRFFVSLTCSHFLLSEMAAAVKILCTQNQAGRRRTSEAEISLYHILAKKSSKNFVFLCFFYVSQKIQSSLVISQTNRTYVLFAPHLVPTLVVGPVLPADSGAAARGRDEI